MHLFYNCQEKINSKTTLWIRGRLISALYGVDFLSAFSHKLESIIILGLSLDLQVQEKGEKISKSPEMHTNTSLPGIFPTYFVLEAHKQVLHARQ